MPQSLGFVNVLMLSWASSEGRGQAGRVDRSDGAWRCVGSGDPGAQRDNNGQEKGIPSRTPCSTDGGGCMRKGCAGTCGDQAGTIFSCGWDPPALVNQC